MITVFILILLAQADAKDPVIITDLPDGVSISGGEELRQVSATWHVFVTLAPPHYSTALQEQPHWNIT
jgi:hypothetical protein